MNRAAWAACVVLAAGSLYMAANVAGNYGGNLSGLFFTGANTPLPPKIEAHTWRVKDNVGYDAQYYHVIAHDLLLRDGSARYLDNPQLRWRRIGVPAMAALLSAGSDRYTDAAYVAVQLAFLTAGGLWFASYAAAAGLTPWTGIGFLFIPAVLVSIDRMTVDLVLAALVAGTMVLASANRRSVYGLLVLAPLVRETGLVLIAGWSIWNLLRRRWRQTVAGAACAVPALAWWLYVRASSPPDGTPWLARYPFSGLVDRTLAGDATPGSGAWLRLAGYTEQLALAGIWLALGLGVFVLFRRTRGLPEWSACAFVIFAALLGKYDIWESAYAAGRTMSPLLVLLAMIAVRDRRPLLALPVFLILPRIALQYEAQLLSAWRNW